MTTATILDQLRQKDHAVRFDWGPTGAAAIADGADVAVVVDVLSFTTTLTLAVERGIEVWPFPWKDERASAYAAERDAVLAVGRLEGRGGGYDAVSLSPARMAQVSGVERLVLPSPNGSSICAQLAGLGVQVVGACLRNRSAAASFVADADVVAVVAAGERWPDGSLRPAVEDLWGAGAVLAALVDQGVGDLSPEARVAEAAFRAVGSDLTAGLRGTVSGLELTAAGFPEDVTIAAGLDVSRVVPRSHAGGPFGS